MADCSIILTHAQQKNVDLVVQLAAMVFQNFIRLSTRNTSDAEVKKIRRTKANMQNIIL